MTAGFQPPPVGLIVADRLQVTVAATVHRDDGGDQEEGIALLLTVDGHLNGTAVPVRAEVVIDTASTAKLTAAFLDALDGMRAAPGAPPE